MNIIVHVLDGNDLQNQQHTLSSINNMISLITYLEKNTISLFAAFIFKYILSNWSLAMNYNVNTGEMENCCIPDQWECFWQFIKSCQTASCKYWFYSMFKQMHTYPILWTLLWCCFISLLSCTFSLSCTLSLSSLSLFLSSIPLLLLSPFSLFLITLFSTAFFIFYKNTAAA